MRFSHEHTPPFVQYREPEPSYETLAGEVFGKHPAVLLWMRDEAGERHFLAITEAALCRDLEAMDEAREALVERWRDARGQMMAEYKHRMERTL